MRVKKETFNQEEAGQDTGAHNLKHASRTLPWARLLPMVFIVFATLVVFWPVIGHQFLAWDDSVDVYNNPYLQSASIDNLLRFWRYPYEGLYLPLTYTFYALVAWAPSLLPATSADGILPDPRLFHSLNLFFHLLSSLIVWRIACLLLRRTRQKGANQTIAVDSLPLEWAACGGALLFAIHPLQVEPVAWVAGMKDALCGLLSLVAVWHYLRYVDAKAEQNKPSRPALHYGIAIAAFALALLAKPTAVVVPVVLWLLTALGWRRSWREHLSGLWVWFLIAAACGLLTRWVQPSAGFVYEPPLWARPLIAGDAIAFYLYKLVLPIRLGPDYGRSPEFVMEQGWLLLTGLAPLLLAIWIFLKRNQLPWLLASAGIFVASLLPVLGLISFNFQRYSTVADRYVYLAMLGPALAMAWGLTRPKKHMAAIGGALVLGFFLLRSTWQIPYWHNTTTFFKHALKINSGSFLAHNNLGFALAERGLDEEAIRHYIEALRLEPEFGKAHMNLANALARQGKLQDAMPHYAEAIRIEPTSPRAHSNMGVALAEQGRYEEAINYYNEALRLQPRSALAHNNLGEALARQRKFQEATQHFNEALRLQPRYAKAHNNLGIVFAIQNRPEEALHHFSEALRLQPDSPKTHYNLAGVYLRQGKVQEAKDHYKEAIRQKPNYTKAHFSLGMVLAKQGKLNKAMYHFSEVLRIDPDNVTARKLYERLQQMTKSSDLSSPLR
ncbi:MAG: tetratricopeptide repeat protein [Desulfobacterales bacterium]